jgi:hypothetical protein
MKYIGNLKDFATGLLQARLDGKLIGEGSVIEIARKCQPSEGFSNVEWQEICNFILKLEKANIIPEAKKLADEYGLEIVL